MTTDPERSRRARLAALRRIARLGSATEATAAARRAFLATFDAAVPPTVSDPEERARRAKRLLSMHMREVRAQSTTRPVRARCATCGRGAPPPGAEVDVTLDASAGATPTVAS